MSDRPRRLDGESTSDFADRVRAWSGGEPLVRKPTPQPETAVRPPPPPAVKAKPPNRDDVVIPAAPGWTPPPIASQRPQEARTRAPVPDEFAFTDRSRLRVQALEFAIRAGNLLGHKLSGGAEILAEAEAIERWIAGTELSGKET